jgi:hypothetical protein
MEQTEQKLREAKDFLRKINKLPKKQRHEFVDTLIATHKAHISAHKAAIALLASAR